MEADVALAVGRTLYSTLSPFHELAAKYLHGVWYLRRDDDLIEVVLDFGSVALIVGAVSDDDTIDFKCANLSDLTQAGREQASEIDGWQEFVGMPFGWGWIALNQQGYCDGLLLSFGGIQPNVLLHVVASEIKLLRFVANAV